MGPVDFTQTTLYYIDVQCPFNDCQCDIVCERPEEFETGDSIQCPYCQRFFELGEEE